MAINIDHDNFLIEYPDAIYYRRIMLGRGLRVLGGRNFSAVSISASNRLRTELVKAIQVGDDRRAATMIDVATAEDKMVVLDGVIPSYFNQFSSQEYSAFFNKMDAGIRGKDLLVSRLLNELQCEKSLPHFIEHPNLSSFLCHGNVSEHLIFSQSSVFFRAYCNQGFAGKCDGVSRS